MDLFMRKYLLLLSLFALSLHIHAADILEAVIDDVVTPKVVSLKITKGKLKPGQKLQVLRDAKAVAELEAKTSSGVCKVLKGTVKVGDKVVLLKDKNVVEDKTNKDGPKVHEQVLLDGPLGHISKIQGNLLLARKAANDLSAADKAKFKAGLSHINDQLDRYYIASEILQTKSLKERVSADLRHFDRHDLAGELASVSSDHKQVAPYFPESAKNYQRNPYGELDLLKTPVQDWLAPQFWGKEPFPGAFTGWRFKDNQLDIDDSADALVRKGIKLDDMSMRGELFLAIVALHVAFDELCNKSLFYLCLTI